jgi:hypothetical protein
MAELTAFARRFSDVATDEELHGIHAKNLHKSWGKDKFSREERQLREKEVKAARASRAARARNVEDEEEIIDDDIFEDAGSAKKLRKKIAMRHKAGEHGIDRHNQKIDAHDQWHERAKKHADPYSITATKKPIASGRRTSYCFGKAVKDEVTYKIYNGNIRKKKDQARQRLADHLLESGTIDEAFKQMDLDESGFIDIKEFTKWCDSRGMGVLYKGQQGDLIHDMDLDGDGQISKSELKVFLKTMSKKATAASSPNVPAARTFRRKLERSELSYESTRQQNFSQSLPAARQRPKKGVALYKAANSWTAKKMNSQRNILKWLEQPKPSLQNVDGPSQRALRLRSPASPIAANTASNSNSFNYIRTRQGWSGR